jgi:hypothetical protein
VGIIRVEGVIVANRQLAMRQTGTDFRPTHERIGKFKRSILDEFSIQNAIGAEIDIFEENAPHGRIDPGAGLAGMDGEKKIIGPECLNYEQRRDGCD